MTKPSLPETATTTTTRVSGWKPVALRWDQLWEERRGTDTHVGYAGVYEFSGRVSTVCSLVGSDVLVPFLVGDLYVNEEKKQCEESLRCVDRLCPLNRTTWKSFWASHGMTTKRLPPKPGWWTHKRPYPVGRGEE